MTNVDLSALRMEATRPTLPRGPRGPRFFALLLTLLAAGALQGIFAARGVCASA